MAYGICEHLWSKMILSDLRIGREGPMKLYCDNKSVISITHNPIQHDQTKHIEIDRHFIKEKLENGLIIILYMSSSNQLADVLTKRLPTIRFQEITCKLEMKNIHSPTGGAVLDRADILSLNIFDILSQNIIVSYQEYYHGCQDLDSS